MQHITIKAEGASEDKKAPRRSWVDLHDVLLLLGIGLIETGLAKIYAPSAYIMGGVFCFTPFLIGAFKTWGKE